MEWMYIRCHFARGQSRFANFDKIVRVHGGTPLHTDASSREREKFVHSLLCQVVEFSVSSTVSLPLLCWISWLPPSCFHSTSRSYLLLVLLQYC